MIIQDMINGITIQVGEPSKNHVRFIKKDTLTHSPTQTIEFHFASWQEVKAKVDKIFLMADQLEKPCITNNV